MVRIDLAVVLGCLAAGPASAQVALPGGRTLEQVDFERHVMGVLSRSGCNAASCHGSFKGKGGFRLSLFAAEPDSDFRAIARDQMGRRIDVKEPEDSLLLQKPTAQEPHGGGFRFSDDSWQYRLLREWISQGASCKKGSGQVVQLLLGPAEVAFKRAQEEQQISVRARYVDGSEEDVTPFCTFRTNDDSVAVVSRRGVARGIGAGSTAIVVSYRDNVRAAPVLVPIELSPGSSYPPVPERNYVDREVFARLRRLNIIPSELSPDEEFLRRVTIDTIGRLPSPDEARAFLADESPDKRAIKIDQLLAHPLHAALWATKFCDITGNDTMSIDRPLALQVRASQAWHDWFRKRVLENVPYDEIVRGVLCATSREGRDPKAWMDEVRKIDDQFFWGLDSDYAERGTLDLFWRRTQPVTPEQWGERTAAAFLGVRLECAQCHKHPFDRWSQADYRAYANIFGAVAVGQSPEAAQLIAAENTERRKKVDVNESFLGVREVYLAAEARRLEHPATGEPLPAKALGGPEFPFETGKDLRDALFHWLRRPDNPFFARAFLNRIWGHYFGVGLVQPVDDFSLANPPSNERLLDALANDFVDSRFDVRHMERVILNSRTYQLSSRPNETNRKDKTNFARSQLRPMMAEVVVDVLNSALGTRERWALDVRPRSHAVELGASELLQHRETMYALRRFGRPPRTSACDCQRVTAPSVAQRLFLMTDPSLLRKIEEPTGRLQKLLESEGTDDKLLDELFLATLSRRPSDEERRAFHDHRQKAPDRRAAFTGVIWALVNTREFLLNH
jgi:hypothetical protein